MIIYCLDLFLSQVNIVLVNSFFKDRFLDLFKHSNIPTQHDATTKLDVA